MTKRNYEGKNLYKIKVTLDIEGYDNATMMGNIDDLVTRPFVKRVNCIEVVSVTKNKDREY